MACGNNFCHLCEEEDVTNVAVVWCADCENFLCKDCERHHGRIKASKEHQTITLDEYKKLPLFIFNTKSSCEKHHEKYDFYCKFHCDPCCVKCIKDNHKDCRDLDPLVEVLRDIKTSSKVLNLDKELSILLGNFEKVINFLNSRNTTLQENKTESLKEIKAIRASINNHLDEIEKKIIDDLSVEFNKIKLNSEHLTSEIENKKTIIRNLQNDLSKMTMFATDLQTFVGLQYLEESTSQEVKFLNDLQKTDQLDDLRLDTKLSSELKCLTNTIRTFGTALTRSSPCTLKLATSGEYQVVIAPTKLSIDDIKPKLKIILKIPKTFINQEIRGCQILPDGRILILDTVSRSLLLFSKDGDYTENLICFDSEPNDICYIKGNLIALTIYGQHKILLIDLIKKNIIKTIKVADTCYGIDSNGETLVVRILGRRKEFLTLDLEGNILSSISVPGECSIRMSLYENNIVCTDWKANLISCYTNNGVLIWTYKHEDVGRPFGITIDKHGLIYVASRKNDKISILSEDGKTSRTILSKENGIVNPYAININKTSSSLLVTNFSNGEAYVFEI